MTRNNFKPTIGKHLFVVKVWLFVFFLAGVGGSLAWAFGADKLSTELLLLALPVVALVVLFLLLSAVATWKQLKDEASAD